MQRSFASRLGSSSQSGVGPTIEYNILTCQVACMGAAKERSESTKFFRRAKTSGRNRVAHANRLILGRMARRSGREFKVLAQPVCFEASWQQRVNGDVVACDLARQDSNESGQSGADAD